jgi:hypothetical protein
MEIEADFVCAYCGERNFTVVDASAGIQQTYVEDCQVCCRPNLLRVEVDARHHAAAINAEVEN